MALHKHSIKQLRDIFKGKKGFVAHTKMDLPGNPEFFTRKSGEKFMTEPMRKGFLERLKKERRKGK